MKILIRCLGFALLAIVAAPVDRSTLPDMQNVAKPNPEPVAPAGWDLFTAPISTAAAPTGTPTIAEWTRAAGPGNSLVLILTARLIVLWHPVREGGPTK